MIVYIDRYEHICMLACQCMLVYTYTCVSMSALVLKCWWHWQQPVASSRVQQGWLVMSGGFCIWKYPCMASSRRDCGTRTVTCCMHLISSCLRRNTRGNIRESLMLRYRGSETCMSRLKRSWSSMINYKILLNLVILIMTSKTTMMTSYTKSGNTCDDVIPSSF